MPENQFSLLDELKPALALGSNCATISTDNASVARVLAKRDPAWHVLIVHAGVVLAAKKRSSRMIPATPSSGERTVMSERSCMGPALHHAFQAHRA